MAQSVFMKADEVQELLGVSRSEAYRIMKKLNDDLKEKGFIVLSGRVSRKYLEEMIYGYPSISDANKEESHIFGMCGTGIIIQGRIIHGLPPEMPVPD